MFPVLFKEPLIREKVMSGKVLIQWRHSFCAELAKSRYMTKDSTKAAHIELANIFFSESNTDDSDEMSTSHSEKTGDYPSKTKAMMQQKDDYKFPPFLLSIAHVPVERIAPDVISARPSNAVPWADVSYSVRHVEECWHHLMRSEDTEKLKTIAVCNFDFLLASVSTVSLWLLMR